MINAACALCSLHLRSLCDQQSVWLAKGEQQSVSARGQEKAGAEDGMW